MAINATYQVEEHDFGTLIFGSIPLNMFKGFADQYPKGVIDPSIAEVAGATHAFARDSKAANAWRERLGIRIDHEDWLKSGDTGLSSKVIYSVLADKTIPIDFQFGVSVPLDPSDFGRCYRLVKRFNWGSRIAEVADRYPRWKPFTDAWAELSTKFEAEGKLDEHGRPTVKMMPFMCDAMQPIVEASRAIK